MTKVNNIRYLAIILLALLISACNENSTDMDNFVKMYGNSSVKVEELFSSVSKHLIFFGHQSVGENILNGISILEAESDVKLNRVTARKYNETDSRAYVDFRVGQNGDLKSKIDDFVSVVKNIPQESHAVAFFKLCYVDVGDETDVEEVFNYYKTEMLNLKAISGQTRIILFTVPITTVQKGWKPIVKKMLGRLSTDNLDNVKRYELNEMIRNGISQDFPVFDLARVESTSPSGDLSTYKTNGEKYPCLSEVYASDNGHLNEFGSKVVAYNLLAFLFEELK